MESLIEVLVWRLTWWLVRILWLPFLIIGFVAYVVLPVLAEVAQLLISPSGLLVVMLLFLWLWRPAARRSRRG